MQEKPRSGDGLAITGRVHLAVSKHEEKLRPLQAPSQMAMLKKSLLQILRQPPYTPTLYVIASHWKQSPIERRSVQCVESEALFAQMLKTLGSCT